MQVRGLRKVLIGLALPLLICLGLVPFRQTLANTNVALILVLVVVAVAAMGSRGAGVLSAASAAVWFDFFLTRPYEQFTILARNDVQTTGLLLLVGVAVTEIAHWGRRQQDRAARQTGYLEGLRLAADAVADGTSGAAVVERACEQVVDLLGCTDCRFDYGTGLDHPHLDADGQVRWGELEWDVEGMGLPVQRDTELRAMSGGRFMGRFLATAAPGTRPPLDRRRQAAALASLVGVALAARREDARGTGDRLP
jgi:hypothetical protein